MFVFMVSLLMTNLILQWQRWVMEWYLNIKTFQKFANSRLCLEQLTDLELPYRSCYMKCVHLAVLWQGRFEKMIRWFICLHVFLVRLLNAVCCQTAKDSRFRVSLRTLTMLQTATARHFSGEWRASSSATIDSSTSLLTSASRTSTP